MPVFHVEKNKGYTVRSNHYLRDKSLSRKAKGLLSQILSLPEELERTEYIVPVKKQDSRDGFGKQAVNRTDAKRVYGFSGCRKRAVALLRNGTVSQLRRSQDRMSASCSGFFVPISTHLKPRFQGGGRSNRIPPYDHRLKALKAGR